MTESELAEILKQLLKSTESGERERDVFTTREFQNAVGFGEQKTRKCLRDLAQSGKISPDKIRIANAWGEVQTIKGWRVRSS